MSLEKNTATVPALTPACLTRHSRSRMQQRGITWEMISIAERQGIRRRSHDRLCLTLTDRSLLGTPAESQADRLRGLCVVCDSQGTIITVKWVRRLRRPGILRRQCQLTV